MKKYKVSYYDGIKVMHVEVKAVSGGMAVEQVVAPLRKVKGLTVLGCKRVRSEKKTEPSNVWLSRKQLVKRLKK